MTDTEKWRFGIEITRQDGQQKFEFHITDPGMEMEVPAVALAIAYKILRSAGMTHADAADYMQNAFDVLQAAPFAAH